MTRSGTSAIFFAILILSGCACVTVTKISPDSSTAAIKGQRFSLPRPYIQVTPKDDGSISADIVYLPDPERTYAVTSFSVFANDSLELSTDGGIVRTINWTGDSSAVVAEAITSAGTAASGILQAEQTKKAEQKEKEDTASKAVDEAQLELQQAQSQLAILLADNTASPGEIRQARIAIDNAAFKLSAAQATLARLRGTTTADLHYQEKEYAGVKAVDDARRKLDQARTESAKSIADYGSRVIAEAAVEDAARELRAVQEKLAQITGQVFGPKLFAIHEEIRESAHHKTTPFLKIVAVEQQAEPPQEGWNLPQPMYPVQWPDAPKSPDVRIFPEGVNTVPDQNNSRWLTLQSSLPLVALVWKETSFKRSGVEVPQPLPIILASPTVINVNLNGFPVGDYTLDLAYQTRKPKKPNEKDGSTTVNIKIEK